MKPADYPTEFLERRFRFLSGRREVRATWLLREVGALDPCKVSHAHAVELMVNATIPRNDRFQIPQK